MDSLLYVVCTFFLAGTVAAIRWMWLDSRRRGERIWPWYVVMPVASPVVALLLYGFFSRTQFARIPMSQAVKRWLYAAVAFFAVGVVLLVVYSGVGIRPWNIALFCCVIASLSGACSRKEVLGEEDKKEDEK